MSEQREYRMINGIKCYNPEEDDTYSNYPDSGFEITDQNKHSFWVRSRNRLFKDIIYSQMKDDGNTKFLEIGCGIGDLISNIISKSNLEITGAEIYTKGLLYAKKHLSNVKFVQFDIAKKSLTDKFDMISAFDVIEHIDDDLTAISNINKMLKIDGIFIVSVPQHKFLWSRLDGLVKHKRRYSRKELISKLEQNGFKICFCTSFVFFLFPLMLISRLIDFDRKNDQFTSEEFEKRVVFPPILNSIFNQSMKIDEFLIRLGWSLPFGGTLLIIAKKT